MHSNKGWWMSRLVINRFPNNLYSNPNPGSALWWNTLMANLDIGHNGSNFARGTWRSKNLLILVLTLVIL